MALASSFPPEHFTSQNSQMTYILRRSVTYSPLLRLEKRDLDGLLSLSLDPWAPIVPLFLLPYGQHHTRGFGRFQFTRNYGSFCHRITYQSALSHVHYSSENLCFKKWCHHEQVAVPPIYELDLNNTWKFSSKIPENSLNLYQKEGLENQSLFVFRIKRNTSTHTVGIHFDHWSRRNNQTSHCS
jgi:hypothetical protein